MTDITPNHPAVETMLWHEGQYNYGEPPETWPAATRKAAAADFADKLMHALPHLTADDLRNTPAGRALMAEALEEEAYRMDVVISNGDAAEQAAPAPGETGRGGAVTARDALYENPAQYLRERADAYRTETPDE